jgi:hypothetical protein
MEEAIRTIQNTNVNAAEHIQGRAIIPSFSIFELYHSRDGAFDEFFELGFSNFGLFLRQVLVA